MLATIKLFITRCFEAVSSVVASVIWVAAKLLGFAFATGLAFGTICAFIASGVLWYFLSSSSIDDKTVYRHLIPNVPTAANKGCGMPGNAVPALADPNGSKSGKDGFAENISADTANFYNCAIQSHVNQSVTYTMAFLEFNDQGQLREPLQWKALRHELDTTPKDQSLTVLVYVHGWRHDAHVGDSDVKRFHILTSLTANYANQTSRNPGKTTSKTIGIYIGWRGRIVDEHADHDKASALRDKLAIPTILSRKSASDSIARPIGQQILDIEKLVKGEKVNAPHRKLIIYGHSLGGNIVIQGLSETLARRIGEPDENGEIRGVGDLVLLLNPASQARHFFLAQQAAINSKPKASSSPVVVSLTASKYYAGLAKHSSQWDTAVGKHLPLAHKFFSAFQGQPEEIQSIGNYLPITVMRGSPSVTITSAALGVSHEIEIDQEAGLPTTYELAGSHDLNKFPKCIKDEPFMRWQATAIKQQKLEFSPGWDAAAANKKTGRPSTYLVLDNPRLGEKEIFVNIRHGVARHACINKRDDSAACRNTAEAAGIDLKPEQYVKIPNIAPAWSPVWNAAVHSNVIAEHGGYLSHTLWCVLNRFALDRPPITKPAEAAKALPSKPSS